MTKATAIPNTVRAIAREAYRHACYTGRTVSRQGGATVSFADETVTVDHGGTVYTVPVAASWL